ncbi:MAG: hypothetical protein ACLSHU_12550 [Oscillospiraceae bacterium]
MAVCEYLGQPDDAVSIYGPYIGSPGSLADNAQLTSGFDLSGYLTMTTNCSSFVAIASGGYEQVTAQSTLEDGTTVDIVQDTERFYLLDAAGYLWILNLYALENDGYGCYITGLLSTDLAGKLPFLQEGDFQYCSMVEDQQTGHLVLSYFTGDTSELFLLYAKEPDSLNLTAVRLGNLGDQNYPAVLYCAESNGEIPSSQSLNGCVLPILQAELPMKQLDLSALAGNAGDLRRDAPFRHQSAGAASEWQASVPTARDRAGSPRQMRRPFPSKSPPLRTAPTAWCISPMTLRS